MHIVPNRMRRGRFWFSDPLGGALCKPRVIDHLHCACRVTYCPGTLTSTVECRDDRPYLGGWLKSRKRHSGSIVEVYGFIASFLPRLRSA